MVNKISLTGNKAGRGKELSLNKIQTRTRAISHRNEPKQCFDQSNDQKWPAHGNSDFLIERVVESNFPFPSQNKKLVEHKYVSM